MWVWSTHLLLLIKSERMLPRGTRLDLCGLIWTRTTETYLRWMLFNWCRNQWIRSRSKWCWEKKGSGSNPVSMLMPFKLKCEEIATSLLIWWREFKDNNRFISVHGWHFWRCRSEEMKLRRLLWSAWVTVWQAEVRGAQWTDSPVCTLPHSERSHLPQVGCHCVLNRGEELRLPSCYQEESLRL